MVKNLRLPDFGFFQWVILTFQVPISAKVVGVNRLIASTDRPAVVAENRRLPRACTGHCHTYTSLSMCGHCRGEHCLVFSKKLNQPISEVSTTVTTGPQFCEHEDFRHHYQRIHPGKIATSVQFKRRFSQCAKLQLHLFGG